MRRGVPTAPDEKEADGPSGGDPQDDGGADRRNTPPDEEAPNRGSLEARARSQIAFRLRPASA